MQLPILYSNLLHKMGTYFLGQTIFIYIYLYLCLTMNLVILNCSVSMFFFLSMSTSLFLSVSISGTVGNPFFCFYSYNSYFCMSKKYFSIFIVYPLNTNGQDFLDKQYVYFSISIFIYIWHRVQINFTCFFFSLPLQC